MEPTSEQELKQLLDEGRISEEEYCELLLAIRNANTPSDSSQTVPQEIDNSFPFRTIPWPIWVVVALLSLEGLSNLLSVLSEPRAIVWLASKVLFVTGLLRGWKWVFVLFQVIAGIHVLYFAMQGALTVSVINLIIMILVGTAYRYYFPEKEESDAVFTGV